LSRNKGKFRKALLAGAFLFSCSPNARAAETIETLKAQGYENLALVFDPAGKTLFFENRRFFLEIEALREVLRGLKDASSAEKILTVVVQNKKVPILTLRFRQGDLIDFQEGRLSPADFAEKLTFPEPPALPATSNPSLFKTDLVFTPEPALVQGKFFLFGNYDALNQWAPGLSTFARLQTSTEGYFPTVISHATIGYQNRWKGFGFAGVAGRMGYDGYLTLLNGWDTEFAYWLFDGRVRLKAELGQRETELPQRLFSLNTWLFPLDLGLSGGYGYFPAGDCGPFVKAVRQFSRSQLELEAARTRLGTMFRVGLGINLWPGLFPVPKAVRLFAPGWLTTEYRAGGKIAGMTFWPRADTDDLFERLSPAYLRAHLSELR
jgi:hypothetical protein